ncbi:MAG: ABC transporter ATP-binding protein [Halolamina sp.]
MAAVGGDDAALLVDDVEKRYGETVALDGVSLSVEAGEVFGLVGPNGAGKTTLVRALTGTTTVEGTVRVFGQPPRAVAGHRVGLLPQSFSPPDRLSARELLRYYAGLYDRARDPDAVLGDVGLADAGDTRYENLSGGQRRRVCVGAALVNDPEALFLDEPTASVDPAGRRDLWRLVEDLAAAGTTVFLTSHSMPEVERLADRVAILRQGSVVAAGTPTDLIAAHGGESHLRVPVENAPVESPDLEYPVTVADGEVVVGDVTPEAIGEVVADLRRVGVDFESFTWSEPTLEDVYLELTGERYASVEGSEDPATAGSEPEPESEAEAEA